MNIQRLNQIFTTRGSVAALASAQAAQMPSWVIRRLVDGSWDPNFKKDASSTPPPPQPVRTIVDRKGDKRIVKVMLRGELLGYELITKGESGEDVTEPLGRIPLSTARDMIGKIIVHPSAPNAGKPTNDPKLSQAMRQKKGS